MVLVDTSVWVDHLRHGNARLAALLETSEVACHPFVIGELACGHLQRRAEILSLLRALPAVTQATDEEVLLLMESRRLHGRGLGWVDVHLLASCRIAGTRLWTLDRTLARAAADTLG